MRYNDINVLSEALGVPDNLYETALEVYEKIFPKIQNFDISDLDDEDTYTIGFQGNFRIADFDFSKVFIKFHMIHNPNVEKPEILSMSVENESKKTRDFRLKNVKKKTANLNITVILPDDYNYKDLTDFLRKEKKEVIESLTHELKHFYDAYKKIYDNTFERALYAGVSGKQFGIWPIDRFLHDIYYTTINESLVRPSEVAAAIRNNEISQKDFLKFLQDNDTYKNLRRISNFTYEGLREEVANEMERVNLLLKHLNYKTKKMSDEEKIDEIMRLVMVNVGNWSTAAFKDILTTSFFEEIVGFQGEKERIFKRFMNRNRRFEDPKDFFKYYEKLFKFVGENMIKKIAKLFAMTKKS